MSFISKTISIINLLCSLFFANNFLAQTENTQIDPLKFTNVESVLGIEVTTLETGGIRIHKPLKKSACNCEQDYSFTRTVTRHDKKQDAHVIIDKVDFFNALTNYKLRDFNTIFLTDERFRYLCTVNLSSLSADQLKYYATYLANANKKKEKPENEIAVTKRLVAEEPREIYTSNVDFRNPGKFFAIIIGVSAYLDPNISDLDSLPIYDALALKKLLNEKYIFEKENIKELYNPTRREIVMAFSEMSKKISANDNLLIFYGGHGHYEKESDLGYWLPSDSEVDNPSNWLYNDQLVADLKKIKSLHTLLISDACFSGSIFKTRSSSMEDANGFIKQKYQLPSRRAITSGTLKTVPNKSVFIKYLLNRLDNNQEKFFTSSQLFQSIEQPVSNNSNNLPQFGVIQNVGDEGGDFIFIQR